MSHFTKQHSNGEVTYLHREFMAPTIISTLAKKGYFSEFRPSVPPVNDDLEELGMVYTEITSLKKGIVRFKDAWWFALSNDNATIYPGQDVRAVELYGSTLLVESCH